MNFYIKNHFSELNTANNRLKNRIAGEKQLISTLKAEIAYVRSPKYLQQLAAKYLSLQNIIPAQIAKDFQQALDKKAPGKPEEKIKPKK
jgi:hypothetical protein